MMLTLVLLTIVVSLLAAFFVSKYQKRGLEAPGPFQWPVVGSFPLLRKLSLQYGGQHHAFIELSRRYSSNVISLRLGQQNIIAVSGYDEIRKVLAASEFDGRPWNEFVKMRNMGLRKGLTMSDGPECKEIRAWFVRSLRELGFGRVEMAAHIYDELCLIFDKIQHGGVFCMRSLLSPAIMNIVWSLGTGRRIPSDAKLREFFRLIEDRNKMFDMTGGVLSLFPWLRYVAPEASGYNLLLRLNKDTKTRLMETIEDHKRRHVPGETGRDIINMFLERMHSEKVNTSIYNDTQLFVILLDLLTAATSTTPATLDFLFLRMMAHQDVQRRLHEELDSVIGHDRLPELIDRPNLPYTEAVITESQRMRMVVPIIGPRRAMAETSLEGYKIPKESCILINLWSVHMNPEFFPDPETFRPERFIKDGAHVPDDKLILFGRGHRRCPGEAEARLITFLFFVRIMQRFQVLPKPGHEIPDLEPTLGMNISPKPYEVLLVPRQRA